MTEGKTLVALVVTVVVFVVSRGAATCRVDCQPMMVWPDCEPVEQGEVVPSSMPVEVVATCEEICCAPIPPNSQTCGVLWEPSPQNVIAIGRANWSTVEEFRWKAAGEFLPTERACGDFPIFSFDSPLDPGQYRLKCMDTASPCGLFYPSPVTFTVAPEEARCVGDCNGDARVSVGELIRGVGGG